MKFIDVVSKTIESAIEEGLEQLNTNSENVEVTILKQPGMFSKAKVRLTVIDEQQSQPEVEAKEEVESIIPQSLKDFDNVIKEEPRLSEDEFLPEENTSTEPQPAVQETQANSSEPAELPVLSETISTVAGKVLEEMTKALDENIVVKEYVKGRIVIYEIEGEKATALIGKEGAALEALQLILNSINRLKQQDAPHIVVRIADYEKTKQQRLQRIATESAERAIAEDRTIRLKTMNSYERRIVHAFLQQDPRVTTESFGVDPYRYITVRPKDKKE